MWKDRCKRLPHLGIVLCLLGGLHFASSQSLFGTSAAGIGDVNGDGIPDYAIGGHAHPEGRYRGAVWVHSGSDHSILYTLRGEEDGDGFGKRVSAIGDVSGDGVTDLLVVSAGAGYTPARGEAFADVHSGSDGSVLFRVDGVHWFAGGDSGAKSAPVGDVNGDGRDDFLALAWPRPCVEPGTIAMISGANGSSLWKVEASTSNGKGRVPQSAASGPDMDGDGIRDVFVGEIGLTWDIHGVVRVLSGRTGAILETMPGDIRTFGSAVALLPDTDGDGKEEIVVASMGSQVPRDAAGGLVREAGSVEIYSGADRALLVEMDDPSPQPDWGSDFGSSIAACGDLDRDGVVDLLISDPRWNASVGAVYAYSSGTGKQIYRITGHVGDLEGDWHFGMSLATVGDGDGDGYEEFLVGCAAVRQPGRPGYVALVSSIDGSVRRRLTRPE
jgi:hypothetical protein